MALRAITRSALAAAAALGAAVAALSAAPAAQAWEGDGRCETGEVCLYWGGNYTGAFRDYSGSVWDFAGHRYPNNGTGAGQSVKNNAASVINRDGAAAIIYYNEGYTGPYDYVAPYTRRNLYYTWNDNASMVDLCVYCGTYPSGTAE
ncbi:peptidase inhibitor family I36 protein [Jiangella rhizosphaerae]|nr:peptidase inhibitor family I36 protein [Jiangella rhizosphaerae]